MINAEDINEVAPGSLSGKHTIRSVKAELFSTALKTALGIYLVDPIPIDTLKRRPPETHRRNLHYKLQPHPGRR